MSSAESENVNTLASNFTNESKFTRAAVESLGNRVSMTDIDEDAGLHLLCYLWS